MLKYQLLHPEILAALGGAGVGLYDWSLAKERARVKLAVEPDAANAARYAELLPLFVDTYHALEPICARIP